MRLDSLVIPVAVERERLVVAARGSSIVNDRPTVVVSKIARMVPGRKKKGEAKQGKR